jgi:hypothetical protein
VGVVGLGVTDVRLPWTSFDVAQLGEGDPNAITEYQTAIQYSALPATGDGKYIHPYPYLSFSELWYKKSK